MTLDDDAAINQAELLPKQGSITLRSIIEIHTPELVDALSQDTGVLYGCVCACVRGGLGWIYDENKWANDVVKRWANEVVCERACLRVCGTGVGWSALNSRRLASAGRSSSSSGLGWLAITFCAHS